MTAYSSQMTSFPTSAHPAKPPPYHQFHPQCSHSVPFLAPADSPAGVWSLCLCATSTHFHVLNGTMERWSPLSPARSCRYGSPPPSIGDSQYRGKPLTWGRLGGQLHHSKHHQTYVNSLNEAEEKYEAAQQTGDVRAQIALHPLLRFHGGSAFPAISLSLSARG